MSICCLWDLKVIYFYYFKGYHFRNDAGHLVFERNSNLELKKAKQNWTGDQL